VLGRELLGLLALLGRINFRYEPRLVDLFELYNLHVARDLQVCRMHGNDRRDLLELPHGLLKLRWRDLSRRLQRVRCRLWRLSNGLQLPQRLLCLRRRLLQVGSKQWRVHAVR